MQKRARVFKKKKKKKHNFNSFKEVEGFFFLIFKI